MSSSTVTPPVGRTLVPLGLILLAAQSFQIVAFPNFLKSLQAEPGWHLSPRGAGLIGSTVFLGVLAGVPAAVPLAGRLGRRQATLAAFLWLTFWSGVCALAAAPWQLGFLRMLAGIGIGVVFPLILSFVKDAATRARRALGTVLIGIPAAGIASQNIVGALPVANAWRLVTAIGAGLGMIALALSVWLLPRGTDMSVLAPGDEGHRKPIQRIILVMGTGVIGVNLIAWSGLPGLTSTDLRFNAVLDAGAVIAIFAVSGVAIHRSETSTSLLGSIWATVALVLINPPTAVLTMVVVPSLLAGKPVSFVMTLAGVWIADGYCRSLTLGVAPHVLDALPHPAVPEADRIAPAPQPLRPGSDG